MSEPVFEAFPKIPRLESESIVVTEKIDGTNAQLLITGTDLYVGSRTRWITPEVDNYGFARWAYENKEELLKLRPGRYYGEWWGNGIQRTYDQERKNFSFFHYPEPFPVDFNLQNVDVVPMLYTGQFDFGMIQRCIDEMKEHGSYAAKGFMKPEGIMVYLCRSKQYYKCPFGK